MKNSQLLDTASYTGTPLPGTELVWSTGSNSPTRAQIVQRLLEQGYVTAEEAVTLLTTTYINTSPSMSYTQPVDPYTPPFRVGDQLP